MKTYCFICGQDVDVEPVARKITVEFKNEEVCYIEHVCFCPHCGEELYVKEFHDSNLNALYDAYRKQKGLISYAEVKELSCKYEISRQNMSLLLGWGEHTFEKFCEGYIPTKIYSDEMKRLLKPEYFMAILEANKGEIPTKAYAKALKGLNTEKIIYNEGYEMRCIVSTPDIIIQQSSRLLAA